MSNTIRPYQSGQSFYSSENDRSADIRRDNDTIKVPRISLYDIDYSIFYHINENWKPNVLENSIRIPVPVMFANGEKWSQIRQYGFLRDKDRKILTPLITLRRLDVNADERIILPTVQIGALPGQSTYRVVPFKSTSMQYDRTSGQYLTKTSTEFHMLDFPTYVRVNYEMIIWTDLQEQMNTLVQGLAPMNGHIWGDVYQFRTVVSNISHDNVNVPGENRLIKTTANLQVDGYLRQEYEYQQSTIQKAYSLKRIEFLNESTDNIFTNEISPSANANGPISKPRL